MNAHKEHICVCICTYKRPQLLQRLLERLESQSTEACFTYSIVVVDNDHLQSAKQVVMEQRAASRIPLTYCVESQQNIALARNLAVQNATGDYIAFIDDDEFPAPDWLLTLFKACNQHHADGVLGPVKPYFENEPPHWVIKGKFFERPTHETGFTIDWTEGRTGNLLFRRQILEGIGEPFRAEYGSGGEDRDFFTRMIRKGHVFIWCNEAIAYEVVPPRRWQRGFMLKRALLRGKVDLVDPASRWRNLAKSAIAIPAYILVLPFLLLLGQHMFMKFLIKTFDHLGRVLTYFGVDLVKEKYVTE
jgi:glycosyltransferase involved in cell wall biosynthesis